MEVYFELFFEEGVEEFFDGVFEVGEVDVFVY